MRKEDIPLLAQFFVKKYSSINGLPVKPIHPRAMEKLMASYWSGNVRELENVIERALIFCQGESLRIEDLKVEEYQGPKEFFEDAISGWPTLEELENRYINMVLDKVHGKKERAAQILGVHRRTLYRKEQEGKI